MRALVSFVATMLFFCLTLHAQTRLKIRGSVIDTVSGLRLPNATVNVLNAKDSTLFTFVWSDTNGSFEIDDLMPGRFMLLVTYPGYADFQNSFVLDSVNKEINFGRIKLDLKARLLEEVIVKGERNLIRMKGDTTEFDAKALIMAPNAKVEDILLRLPGIRVDNNGRITAYGQNVNRVLVDGEEFFGDDPTLVTRNLRADMVDKIQLYDKMPDQSTFPKINDDKNSKTLNVVLKEDKKNGYFGKVDGGIATSNYSQTQGMVNKFDAKQKFSNYGTFGNLGRTGLSSTDYNKYSTSSDNIVFIGGNIYSTGIINDELSTSNGKYNGKGIPEAQTGGIHYDSKFNNGSLNANYRIGKLDVTGTDNILTQNNLESFSIENNNVQKFENTLIRQKVDVSYQSKMGPSSTLKISTDATIRRTNSKSRYQTSVTRDNSAILNEGERSVKNEGKQNLINMGASYSKKFKKENRSLSMNLGFSGSENISTGYLNSVSQFIGNKGIIDSLLAIDQLKINDIDNSTYSGTVTYSEPLSKQSSLLFFYGLGYNQSRSDRASFNKSVSGNYDIFDREFSNDYVLNQFSNQFGSTYFLTKNKQSFEAGTKFSIVSFDQRDQLNSLNINRNLLYFNPLATYRYRFSNEQSIRVQYFGNTIQPTLDQLQPLKNNIDPLSIVNGNPNLNPAFHSSFNIDYNSFKTLSQRNIIFAASYSFTLNPISYNIITDLSGKTIYQPDNISQKSDNLYLRANWGKKIDVVDAFLSLNFSYNVINNFGLSNSLLNKRNSQVYSGGFDISKSKAKKYDFYVHFSPRHVVTQSSIENQVNFKAPGLTSGANVVIYLPRKLEFRAGADYEYQAKTQVFPKNLNILLINSSFALKFLKSENLKLSLSANDLLNNNTGFRRDVFGTTISQNNYTTIRRYFMLSLIWDFSKFNGGVKSN